MREEDGSRESEKGGPLGEFQAREPGKETYRHTHTHTHIEYICEQLEFSIYMYSWGGKLGTWAILTLFTLGKVNLTSLNIFF